MDQDKINILQKNLKTEKAARKAAEKIVEDKSKDLHLLSHELKKTNLKLEAIKVEHSSQLETVFENINDGYISMDLFGNVQQMNNNAKEFFGYNIEEEELNVFNLIYPDDFEHASKSFVTLNKEGSFTNYRTRVLTKDKQVIGLLKSYHRKWQAYAKGVNFNIKKEFVNKDGFKLYCISKFPKYAEKLKANLH